MEVEQPNELEKALAEYSKFRSALTDYGHTVETENVLHGEKVVEITTGHKGKAVNADTLIAHLGAVLGHAKQAEDIRQRIRIALSQNGNRKMAQWQAVRNLRLIRDGLLTKTKDYVVDQIGKIEAILPRERTKPNFDMKTARETARLTGLLAAYKRFKREYETEKRKHERKKH